ncbi:hypothetical protein SAMN05443247_00498 [Bradyrhizobium erythrophlei]|jgi:hypothetical protein|nr:hypothetical protein SAMN05443247_00498 [Bradyrhizobium erythrophlei]
MVIGCIRDASTSKINRGKDTTTRRQCDIALWAIPRLLQIVRLSQIQTTVNRH